MLLAKLIENNKYFTIKSAQGVDEESQGVQKISLLHHVSVPPLLKYLQQEGQSPLLVTGHFVFDLEVGGLGQPWVHIALDVTGMNPLHRGLVDGSAEDAGQALLIAKRRKGAGAKAAACEKRSLVFVPLAVGTRDPWGLGPAGPGPAETDRGCPGERRVRWSDTSSSGCPCCW